MKAVRFTLILIIVTTFMIAACQRNNNDLAIQQSTIENAVVTSSGTTPVNSTTSSTGKGSSGTCNPNAYSIVLESHTQVNGNWEWVWSVQNPNPGNGSNGTSQNLSHWGMQFGSCFNWNNVVSAAYSADGITWTAFTPVYQVDPSQQCLITPVLKFDYGTQGNAKSYYRLVVSTDYPVGVTPGYYKSGANTGCCVFNFTGISCSADDGGDR